MLGTFFVFAFEGILLGIYFFWDKFVDMKERSPGACVFES